MIFAMQQGHPYPPARRRRWFTFPTALVLLFSLPAASGQVLSRLATQTATHQLVIAAQAVPRDHLAAARWLEQAAFGPTPAEIARVRSMGSAAWLAEQLAMPETAIEQPADNGLVRAQYLSRLSRAPDQLRQRVAYALGQMLVVSMQKNPYPEEVVPHLRTLSRHAFGNYRALLGEVTISPQMGKYLDLANSNKPGAGSAANENFARELLQLFTTGTVMLNPDGRPRLDAQGLTIPAYDQNTVQQLALALTGWTYAGAGDNNWENFSGPMQPRDVNHDMRAKSFLGCNLAAGQTTLSDLNAALDCVFRHPNVGPFVALRLIRSMVISNPSPAYVQRVSQVFDNNGAGVRGDLRAVVQAVLLDAEARGGGTADSRTAGKLKDPITHTIGLVRALGGSVSPTNQIAWYYDLMAQMPLAPPSVFGHYSPLFRVPQSTLAGPEFQIYTPTEAVQRGNLFWHILDGQTGDMPVDIAPFVALGDNVPALIDAVDKALLHGRMPSRMRQVLSAAVTPQYDRRGRALTALYLTALSGLYAVQY
jgi:uncharacterized protein (DUF1800 family)